jgi:Flp pilus assembly protein TadD
MTTRTLLSFSLSTLLLGGATVGCAVGGTGIASAGTRSMPAGKDAALARKALGRRDAVTAVGFAEAAVASSPGRADHRMLLAQSYLQAGRFRSARDAFGDVLRLTPEDGKAALNLVLAEIATGDWPSARATLDAHAARIAPADRGLALALAGDPAGAVTLLTAVARQPGAGAKVRQNLALALALSGQWPMARAVAAVDLSPADVDGRMAEWAHFAQPVHAADQVAALLGVRAIEDRGQPLALALVAPVAAAGSASAPVVVAAPPMVPAAPVVPAATPGAAPMLAAATIVFAPRREVVQPLPVLASAPLRPGTAPMKWVVQLGAFGDARGAEAAWQEATRRFAGLGDHAPQSMTVRAGGATLHRLSVAGFDRAGADALCARYRAQGGVCFVRRGEGDRVAQWLRPAAWQVASR